MRISTKGQNAIKLADMLDWQNELMGDQYVI